MIPLNGVAQSAAEQAKSKSVPTRLHLAVWGILNVIGFNFGSLLALGAIMRGWHLSDESLRIHPCLGTLWLSAAILLVLATIIVTFCSEARREAARLRLDTKDIAPGREFLVRPHTDQGPNDSARGNPFLFLSAPVLREDHDPSGRFVGLGDVFSTLWETKVIVVRRIERPAKEGFVIMVSNDVKGSALLFVGTKDMIEIERSSRQYAEKTARLSD